MSCLAAPASAALIITQEWERDPTLTGDFAGRLITTGIVDDSALTGVGQEFVLMDRFTIARFSFAGIGQSFESAIFTSPPSLSVAGNALALFENGVFRLPGVSSSSSSATAALFDESFMRPTGGGYGFRQRGPNYQLIYFLPVSGRWWFNLQSTTIERTGQNPDPNVISAPGGLALLLVGLIGAAALRRRRKAATA